MTDYDTGYPSVPIGGENPYYKCQYCGKSDPEINGILTNHLSTCTYRIRRESEPGSVVKLGEVLEWFGVMDDELYDALKELIVSEHN